MPSFFTSTKQQRNKTGASAKDDLHTPRSVEENAGMRTYNETLVSGESLNPYAVG